MIGIGKTLVAASLAACLVATGTACSSGGGASSQPASEASSGAAASSAASSQTAVAVPADGTYDIQVKTNSSMFHVDACTLTVEDGAMTATITLPGEGFSRLFFGTVEEAEKAADADIYDYKLDDEGKYTITFPVEALETEYDVAVWGQRRDRWYPHTILFHEPGYEGADAVAAPSAGEYSVAVTLEGGSGRATVTSPAALTVAQNGSMTATIEWSSPNYDKMVVDDEEYLPVNSSGNSQFTIPVDELDKPLAVQAETTAMSEPHLIDYALTFDSSSLQAR